MSFLAVGVVVFAAHRPVSTEKTLLLKNVAALAKGENPEEKKECYNTLHASSASDLPILNDVVYCLTCEVLPCQIREAKSNCPQN